LQAKIQAVGLFTEVLGFRAIGKLLGLVFKALLIRQGFLKKS
jgi:hypothetical protein